MAKSLLFIAIDFGTAYSGYSVKCNKSDIGAYFRDHIWGQEFGVQYCKTPSCILFDKNKEFVDFGFAAMKKYSGGYLKDNLGYFFENFKMDLYRNEGIHMAFEISAVNKGKMKAIRVISESLKFLKNHALKRIRNVAGKFKLLESDITWVLTVPAIWDDAAKHFMREAAKQAGLVDSNPDRLILALEPEAAAVYCKQLPSDGFVGGEEKQRLDQMPGMQIMTVDCGGGTIDITVHEVIERGMLKQVDQASGNDLGGQNIDRQFKDLLKTLCGPVWEEYEKDHAHELQEIMYKFASAKCADHDNGFKFSCPYNLAESIKMHKKCGIEQAVMKTHGVCWDNGYIFITPSRFRSFFDKSLRSTSELLNGIMRKPELDVDYLVLVGGFSLCKILRDHIKDEFESECTVLCPLHPQESVMVGAAEFGSQPQIVKSRICALTYGVGISRPFDESKHKPEKRYETSDGETRCKDLFKRLVQKGESVDFDETRDYTFHPVSSDQTKLTFRFFSTTRPNSDYVDDWAVTQIDSLTVPMPDTSGGRGRDVKLEVKFGFTEITATATDITSGIQKRIQINFMRELRMPLYGGI